MPTITYRLSRFGTVLLTPEQQFSNYLLLRVACVFRRSLEYPNPRYIPPQNNWLYWVGVDRDMFVSYDGYARWYRQQWLIWEYPESSILNATCQTSNDIYLEVMKELAKKPNIPPLPPSTPPLQPPFSTIGRLQTPSVNALTFVAFNDGDFDVTLDWQSPPPVGPCSPAPSLPPPPGPPESSLPPPAPNMTAPPPLSALTPPVGSSSTPAQGASLVPPGFPPGYQSAPPNTTGRLRLAFAATQLVNGATCLANISFTEFREINWSGPTPVAGDFQMQQEPAVGVSCGFPFAPFTLRYKGARYQPLVSTVNLGANNPIWPCTSVQRL